MEILGILLIIFGIFCIIKWIIKDGILFFLDYSRIIFMIWCFGLGLYDLALSDIYSPSLSVNVVSILLLLNFYMLTLVFSVKKEKLVEIYSSKDEMSNVYVACVFCSLLLGVLSFIVNLKNNGLRLFTNGIGGTGGIALSYFFILMSTVSLYYYIRWRDLKKKSSLFFMIISLFVLLSDLSRGPLVFFGMGVLIYELCRMSNKLKTKIRLKHIVFFVGFMIIAIWIFGALGDYRIRTYIPEGATAHYRMPEGCPSGFTWVYIYWTSPLENIRYFFEHQNLNSYAYFNLLLYPFVKLGANIFGMGEQYAEYASSFNDITPYLWDEYGLNVSSFMSDAYKDFGFLGIIVYVLLYDIIAYFITWLINTNKLRNISKALIIPLLLQIALWSIFENSIFRMAGLWVNIFFVLIWDLCGKYQIKCK